MLFVIYLCMSKIVLGIDAEKNLHELIAALQLIHINMTGVCINRVSPWSNMELYVYCDSIQAIKIEKMKQKTWAWLRVIITANGMQDMIEALKNKQIDGCITCGDIYEFFNLAKTRIAPLKMIKHPILASMLPVDHGVKILSDVSGYVFESFRDNVGMIGMLAGIYAKELLNIKEVKISLLKYGYEGKKGSIAKDTIEILAKTLSKNKNLKFIGAIDADQILSAENHAHVIVTDSVTGMSIMKYTRGLAGLFVRVLKTVRGASLMSKMAWKFSGSIFNAFKTKMNVEYGSFILGLQGVLAKADDYTNANGLYNVMLNALKLCRARAVIYDELEKSLAGSDLGAQSVWSLYANTAKTVQTKKNTIKPVDK